MHEIASWIGNNSGYEWGEIRVYQNNAYLAVDYQSGCSCEDYEPPKHEDLMWSREATVFYGAIASMLDAASTWFTNAQSAEIKMEARKLWDNREETKNGQV